MNTIVNINGKLNVKFADGTTKVLGGQLNLRDVISAQIYLANEGWIKCEVSLTDEQIEMFVSAIGGQNKTKNAVRNYLSNPYTIKGYSGLFERLLITEGRDNTVRCVYCAG